jgi:hypothetical protein
MSTTFSSTLSLNEMKFLKVAKASMTVDTDSGSKSTASHSSIDLFM